MNAKFLFQSRRALRTLLASSLLVSSSAWAVFPTPRPNPDRERQIRELENHISREQSDLSRTNDQIRSLESDARRANDDADRLRRELDNTDRNYRDVSSRLQQASSRAEHLRRAVEGARQQRQRDIQEADRQLNERRSQQPILEAQIRDIDAQLNALRNELNAGGKAQLEQQKRDKLAAIERDEVAIRDYDERIKRIDDMGGCQSPECMIVYKTFVDQRERLRGEVAQLRQEIASIDQQLSRFEQISQRIAALEGARQKNVEALNWVNGQINELQARLDELRRRPIQEEVELAVTEQEIARLQPEERRLRDDVDRLRRDQGDAQRRADDINRRVRDLCVVRDNSQRRIDDLQRQLADLRREPDAVERLVLMGDRLDSFYRSELSRDGVIMVNLDSRSVDSRDLEPARTTAVYLLADSLSRSLSSQTVSALQTYVSDGGLLFVVGDVDRQAGNSRSQLERLLGSRTKSARSASSISGRNAISGYSASAQRGSISVEVLEKLSAQTRDALVDQLGNVIGTERSESGRFMTGHALALGIDLNALPSTALGDIEARFCRNLSDFRERDQRQVCN